MTRAHTQADRAAALRRAERTLERKLTSLKRLVTSIQLWQRRVKYYTIAAAQTDEERAAARAAAQTRKAAKFRSSRRIITGD